jgi:hypothetical protein
MSKVLRGVVLAAGIVALATPGLVALRADAEQRQSTETPQVTVVLGRPTDRSVTLNVLAAGDADAYVELETGPGSFVAGSAVTLLPAGAPAEIRLDGLEPDRAYGYRLRSRGAGTGDFEAGEEHSFHTARPPGASYHFDIEADPHLDENTSPELLARTFRNILSDRPDFLVDLGDTFMSEKLARTRDEVLARHLLLRSVFEPTCSSVPLFLVLGNHEGESSGLLDGTGENIPVWATSFRKAYFPNPEPDNFYSGDGSDQPFVGRRQSIYSWEWGDALFVVLDPYWFTTIRGGQGSDDWSRTLGFEQYLWLREVLARSEARFKIVFIHNLVGGLAGQMRGGTEAAPFYEWGGENADGSWGFDAKRPGWGDPIHQLLVSAGVDIVFHGHDHLFARQELDGIVYQEVPQPGWPGLTLRDPSEYGYLSGTFLPSSGHLRVTVSPARLTVEYVRSYLAKDENDDRKSGDVGFCYSIEAFPNPRDRQRLPRPTP